MTELGLSNAEVGRRMGVSGEIVRRYRSGAVPSADKVKALADALGLSQSELLGEAPVSSARLGPPMGVPPSMADMVGHPEAASPYDHLVRAGRAVVAEARDGSGRIIYALRVEFLAVPEPAQILTDTWTEPATTAGTTGSRPRPRTGREAA